ncbi:MAG: S1 RNA-binding domain-containing protein [Planctomycetota bacterium]
MTPPTQPDKPTPDAAQDPAPDAAPNAAPDTPVRDDPSPADAKDDQKHDSASVLDNQAMHEQIEQEIQGEYDAALAELDQLEAGALAGAPGPAAHDAEQLAEAKHANASTTKQPGLRGPRVVQAGREHRTGTVVSVGSSDLFVEFGPKELGVCDRTQWSDAEVPKPGDQIEVVIDRYEATESLYVCSRPGAVKKADWEMLEPGQTVEAKVTGSNKGGLEMEVAGHRAFMPASQVSLDRVPDLSIFHGQKLTCQVQRVDRRGAGNIVLSRRDILQAERKKLAEELRGSLQEGQTVKGKVKKIMPFGAFVDIGGIDGLIHVSDLSHDRVNMGEKNIARHVQEGQELSVQILKLDWENNRIGLGLKQLMDDPFAAAMEEIAEGAIVSGTVKNLAEFGAFVELPGGLEGLVHISEIDYKRVENVSDALQVDQVVSVKVLKLDSDSRRISLSIKQTKDAPKREGGGRGGPGAGKGGRGRGKGRGERDDRSAEEILKETPALRRMREKAQADKARADKDKGGLDLDRFGGMGLGDLKL